MNTIIGRDKLLALIYILPPFTIFLLQSCATTSTPALRLEGDDFVKNLPGKWEGNWFWNNRSGEIRINIIEIDENRVKLTGFAESGGETPSSEEVYGRFKDSTLLLTWPLAGESGINEEYKMIRDNSNNLILDGRWKDASSTGKSKLKKIE